MYVYVYVHTYINNDDESYYLNLTSLHMLLHLLLSLISITFFPFYILALFFFITLPFRYGSLTQASTIRLGRKSKGGDIYVPISNMLPMMNPDNIEIDGWDISNVNLAEAMARAKVLDVNLQVQLRPCMTHMQPRKSPYYSDFIASNQVLNHNFFDLIFYAIEP